METRPAFATYNGLRIFATPLGARRAARKAQGPVIGYMVPHHEGDAFPSPRRITASATLVEVGDAEKFDPYAIRAGD